MISPFSFVILRAPSYSLQQAYAFPEKIEPIFEEGIYLSSSEYWQEYQRRNNLSEDKKKEKIDMSFSKFWIRNCMRCTPYGTFAGSGIVKITNEETKIVLEKNCQHIRRIRVDMNYMSAIIQALSRLTEIQQQIRFFTNNSLYELPDALRYAEYSLLNNTRKYQLTSVKKTSYLTAILLAARNGATMNDLVKLLVNTEHVSKEEALQYIVDLWESQILVHELEPCVTGKEPIDQLIDQLANLKAVEVYYNQLKEIQSLIANPEEGVAHYQRIEQQLNKLDLHVEIPKNTLQTDLFLSTKYNSLNQELIDSIIRQAKDLMHLAKKRKNIILDNFKDKFYARYEESEVPLPIALDADFGVGYADIIDETAGRSELIDDLEVQKGPAQLNGEFDYIQQYTLSKYYDYLNLKKGHIEIEEIELLRFKDYITSFKFPNSLYLMGSLLKSGGLLDKTNFIFDIIGFGGPSAANLLGRFTHGNQELCNLTREVLKTEQSEYPNAIYAEVVHLPQARIGNVILRPILRDFEIPFIGKSGADPDNQIPIDDLMLSIKNGELVLRSKRLNKRVIPRLTTAHNFQYNSLPVYRFLGDLQSQNVDNFNVWDWGHLAALKCLPRVTYKGLIIAKAQWKIFEEDIKDISQWKTGYLEYFQMFREKWEIPQKVVYVENDNNLLIDFEVERGIQLFLHYLKRNKWILLVEYLFTEENCIVTNTDGLPFTNELIIPLKYEVQVKEENIINEQLYQVKRKFAPYSEWLYFKIYCGTKTCEKILKETVLPFIEHSLREQLFERFFFLRYKDDFSHFRIRFYNSNTDKQLPLYKSFLQALEPSLEKGLVDKVVIDTYVRELERYGSNLIEETEALFFNDSLAILRFIDLLDDSESIKYKLIFGMRSTDRLLDDFGLLAPEKLELVKRMLSSFFIEFGGSPSLKKQLDDKYRKYQKAIFSHMMPENDETNQIEDGVAIFNLRSAMNKQVIESILFKITGIEKGKIDKLLPSYIHLTMNRLFTSYQRKYELIIYYFLEKYYLSQKAIKKNRLSDLQ